MMGSGFQTTIAALAVALTVSCVANERAPDDHAHTPEARATESVSAAPAASSVPEPVASTPPPKPRTRATLEVTVVVNGTLAPRFRFFIGKEIVSTDATGHYRGEIEFEDDFSVSASRLDLPPPRETHGEGADFRCECIACRSGTKGVDSVTVRPTDAPVIEVRLDFESAWVCAPDK
ncbi:MAG: hypothetical protein U0271_26090 [Polyangiaceae bacterium]